jgi:hypothetical protein
MAIELNIQGYFDMTIYDMNGFEVSEEKEKEILSKLQSGEYLIGINSGIISSIEGLSTPLFKFEIDPTDAVDYDFDEL